MQRILLFATLLLATTLGRAQVTVTTDFESGSLGSYRLLDSRWIKTSDKDSVQCISLQLTSRPDPVNPIDTTLDPSARWFYFRITGVKNKLMMLAFQNTDPLRPVYSYDNENFTRFDQTSERSMRYTFAQRFTHDTVYVAYCMPYTYSYLQKRIATWAKHPWVKVDTIGYTRGGLPMQRLTVTDFTTPDVNKKRIWMHGRIHTSETPASWHFDGFIDALVADNSLQAAAYRSSMTFSIVPFANPDGVVQGLSRSNPSGTNMEINWARPDEQTQPEIKAMKAAILKLTADRPLDMLLNMHSQVANNATYWVHTAASTTPCYYKNQLALCYLNMFDNPYLYPGDLDYSGVAERYVEGWIWKQAGEKTLAITFETPYTFYHQNADGVWVSPESLRDFGRATLTAVGDYYGISNYNRIIIPATAAKTKGSWSKEDFCAAPLSEDGKEVNDLLYLGSLRLKADKVGSRISYHVTYLAAGNYTVYRWIPGTLNKPADNTSCWMPVGYHVQEKNGSCKLQFTATQAGEAFDALLLVRQ